MTDLAQITICIVQMAREDLCHLVHVLRPCAIKYKASVCRLRAANWHFADCGLSVSHMQILAVSVHSSEAADDVSAEAGQSL